MHMNAPTLPRSSTAAIALSQVRKTFGPKVAVEGLDLAIPQGGLIGLIGPNGAGKTTTIRMIMSIIFADSGDIQVLGKASAIESKDRIGYLPEERGLYKKMKVGAFLKYVAKLKGLDGGSTLERDVRDWLEKVALGDCYRKRCEELSKGMQQKVQFIASVIHKPDLLILDEPFSGLDPVNARLLRGLVDEQHKRGCTLIFSTHQMAQAEALCDRVVMIHQGKKVLDNTLGEIHSRYTPKEIVIEPMLACSTRDILAALERGGATGVTQVTQASVSRGSQSSAGRYVAHLAAGANVSHVLQALGGQIACSRIELVKPTLEDVFIEIVAGTATTPEERDELLAMMKASGKGEQSGD
jgi:ABC-2 type transport system ATP-binding protein